MINRLLLNWARTLLFVGGLIVVGPLCYILWFGAVALVDGKPSVDAWLQSAANIFGAVLSGGVAAFVALWILKREERVMRELAKARVEAFTRNLNNVARHDLEIMKAIGHALSMEPHDEMFRAQGKLLPGVPKLTDAMQRDLAAADPKIYACAINLELARENTRQAALGNGGSDGWSLGDHFTNLAAVWVHMLDAVDGFGLLLPQGKRALDAFTHMYKVFAPFSDIDQRLRKREEQELPLPPIPRGGERANRPPPDLPPLIYPKSQLG